MREHLLNKTLLRASPPASPRGDVFHAAHRMAAYRPHEPDKGPDDSGEKMERDDLVSAAQCAHEETVALWLAGSWRCNLAPSRDAEASWMDRHAKLKNIACELAVHGRTPWMN